MRSSRGIGRSLVPLVLTVVLLVPSPGAGAVPLPPGTFISANLELLATVPNPGVIGARFRDTTMFVTSVAGLTTYDISDPVAPTQLGFLPLPHFENEDVDLGGDILLISNDAAESTGVLYVIDISDPAAPALLATHQMGGNPVFGGPGHTASCIRSCQFAWITDGAGIRVLDLRNPASPVSLGTFATPAGGGVVTHDVQVDGNGLMWVVGFGGTAVYELPAGYAGNGLGTLVATTSEDGFSTYFEEFGIGSGGNFNDFIHHNSRRLRNGKVLYVTEEDYTRPACEGAGSFQTWSIPVTKKKKPNGSDLTPLDKWQPELLADSSPTAAMCSAHYFDLKRNVVSQGWYEMGVRLYDVSKPADIRQIGFFITPASLVWAAYFAPTDPAGRTIYVLDFSHGIDILDFDRPTEGPLSLPADPCDGGCPKPPTVVAPIRASWRTPPVVGVQNGDLGFACRLSAAP